MTKQTQTTIRVMAMTGKHLAFCMADAGKRAEGWRLMWRAVRICRRLGTTIQALGVWL
jgi:hypothetical protein